MLSLSSTIDYGNPLSSHPLNDGLGAWWLQLPLNRGGQYLLDLSRNAFHGLLVNSPTWVGGTRPSGFGALNFTGLTASATYVNFGTCADSLLRVNQAATVSVWMYCRTLGGSALGTVVDRSPFLFNVRATNVISCSYGSNAIVRRSSINAFAFSTWTHVVFTRDSSQVAANSHLYVNGIETGYSLTTDGATPSDVPGSSILLGARITADRGFDGFIDDVRLYNYALPSETVYNLYSESAAGYPHLLHRLRRLLVGGFSPAGTQRQGTAALACISTITTTSKVAHKTTASPSCLATLAVNGKVAHKTTASPSCLTTLSASGTVTSPVVTVSGAVIKSLNSIIAYGNPVAEHPLNEGLVSWWLQLPLNRGGTRLMDLCDRNHGTLVNAPTWVGGGRPGGFGALRFDGTDDRVDLPAGVLQGIGNTAFTVSAWGTYTTTALRAILSDTGTNWFWGINASKMYFQGSAGTLTGSTTLTAGAWYHFALTRNGTTSTLYLNGVADGTNTSIVLGATGSTNTLGATPAGSFRWDGLVDDIRIHNVVLSSADVRRLYDESRTGYLQTVRRLRRTVIVITSSAPAGVAHQGNASLTAVATLTASGQRNRKGNASLFCVATLTASGTVTAHQGTAHQGIASLACVATITATGQRNRKGNASLSCVATITATGQRNRKGNASLSCVATITATGQRNRKGNASLACVASVSANAKVVHKGNASLVAIASLTATGTVAAMHSQNGIASLTARATLTASGKVTHKGNASLTCLASLTATGRRTMRGSASLASVATLTPSGKLSKNGSASLSALASLSATGRRAMRGTATLGCLATVNATGTLISFAHTVHGNASLAALASLTVSGHRNRGGDAFLASTATLTGAAMMVSPGGCLGGSLGLRAALGGTIALHPLLSGEVALCN